MIKYNIFVLFYVNIVYLCTVVNPGLWLKRGLNLDLVGVSILKVIKIDSL